MNVLLISINRVINPYPVYPIGLDYVATAIEDKHNVRIVDLMTGIDKDEIRKEIQDFSPQIIGISIRNIDNTDILQPEGFVCKYRDFVREIKSFAPVPIVLGGSGYSLFPEQLLKALEADYGMVGEGERFAQFLEKYENGEDVCSVPGVVTGNKNSTSPRLLARIEARKFNKQFSHQDYYLKHGGMLNLQTKRGCELKCIYCTYPALEGRSLRYIDPNTVAEEARAIQDRGAKYFYITDSAFNLDEEYCIKIARAFIEKKVSIPWGAFFSPMKPGPDFFSLLADSGLTHVEFGTESLSKTMLKNYRKPFNVEEVFSAHSSAMRAGCHVAHFLLLGGPGETGETVNETVANAIRLERTLFFCYCGIRIFPGTELYDIALAEGQVTQDQDLLEPVFYGSPGIGHDEIAEIIEEKAGDRERWIIGSVADKTIEIITRMHNHGYIGPLWEYLVR
jgi:radical SAM superfamily enzyme YgiQ (UPF0313 family)